MKWRIMLELAGPDGTPQMHEVGAGERSPTGHAAATLGLSLAEGRAILAALQRSLVAAQVDEHCRNRRRCDRCGTPRPLKGSVRFRANRPCSRNLAADSGLSAATLGPLISVDHFGICATGTSWRET